MILTIDIGNSNIVLGGVCGDEITFEARLKTDPTKTSDQYCVDLKILLEIYGVDPRQIEGTIIASVVPQVLNSVQTAVKKLKFHSDQEKTDQFSAANASQLNRLNN